MTVHGVDFYQLSDLLAPEERMRRDRVRAWVDERFLPVVVEHFRRGTFPLELVPEMGELGCFGAHIKGYGCPGLGSVSYGLIMQELERGDSGLRTFASVQGALAMAAIHRFGSEAQKERWLPAMVRGEKIGCFGLSEPGAGSDPAGMTTTARRTSSGYVIDGAKMWIGNGSLADVAVVWAKLSGELEEESRGDGGASIRGFLIERGTPGFAAEDIEGKLSLRAARTSRLSFEGCEVGEDSFLPHTDGLKSALHCLNHARYGIAWGAVGAAAACYEEAQTYARQRRQFGRPLASFQLVQAKLARMLGDVTRAQLVAFRLAQLKDANRVTPAQISMAKMGNVAIAQETARTARDILGGVGILDEHQCFRHMVNLESVATYEGTSDIHLLIQGREITGMGAFQS